MSDNNTSRLKLQVLDKPVEVPSDAIVMLTRQGKRYAEVLYMRYKPRQGVRKMTKDEYVVFKTGEVKNYAQNDKKQAESLAKTFAALRGIIRANFDGDAQNQKMITLTYKTNMRDPKRLMQDFHKFWEYFQKDFPGHKLDYVAVAEPQERGAWHLHVMCKSDQDKWWVDIKQLNKRWKHGNTDVEALKSDDMGQYYVAYFTSLCDESKAEKDRVSQGMSKSRKKGGRLHFYPKGMRFYRCSRGIIRPHKEPAVYRDVDGEYGKPRYSDTYALVRVEEEVGEEEKEVNVIQKQTHVRAVL